MNTEQIMALADAYAEGYRWLTDEATEEARAALEAALTEKQEPVAWRLYKDGELYALRHEKEDRGELYTWEPLYLHPAPVNQQLLEACKAALSDDQPYIEKCRAAIAAAEGKV